MIAKVGLVSLAWLAAIVFANPSRADTVIAVPTPWRLQNYLGSVVTVYYTGSPCVSGNITMLTSTTTEERNRFWSLVMTGKASGKPVGISYTVSGGNCTINDFFFPEGS